MLDIKIESSFDGQRIAKEIRDFAKKTKDLRPAWRKLVPILAEMVRGNIEGKGSPIGVSWAPLSPHTKARKARLGQGRAALVQTGRLLATVSKASKGRRSLGRSRVKFGPREKYAFVQHFGSKSKNIPARPYLGWTVRGTRAAITLVEDHLTKLLLEAQNAINGGAL